MVPLGIGALKLVSTLAALAVFLNYLVVLRLTAKGGAHQTFEVSQLSLLSAELTERSRLGLTHKNPVEILNPITGEKRKIHGRFLHITDFHPDPHYKEGSDVDGMCHGSDKGLASKYGDAILGCDSPMILVENTIKWVEENLKDKIDFIVWTGDNMRHDNDRRYPRTESDIFDMNEEIAELMHDKFGDLPIPSLGNNDVFPHNLFAPGPTLQTREFFKLWRAFVPQSQLHIFNRGAYFFQEVIPNQLAVLSINTLYLFASNPLVDSCDRKKDPGYKLFLWLGYVLKEMRKRNIKVWLTGHVPPHAKNYDISCLRKYVAWSHEYRDVIIGGLYGHMNIDHFLPLDAVQAYKSIQKKYSSLGFEYDNVFESTLDETLDLETIYAAHNSPIWQDTFDKGLAVEFSRNVDAQGGIPSRKVAYMDTIREFTYAEIKGKRKSGNHGERYSVVHVASSIVPTFNPGMRVWEYNITDLYDSQRIRSQDWDSFFAEVDAILEADDETIDRAESFLSPREKIDILKKDKTLPPKMPEDLELGPAYVPQLFTPERYVQYYLDLEAVNKKEKPFDYEIEYTTDDKAYKMRDLTVALWLKLGRSLGEPIREEKKNQKKKKKQKAESKLEALWKKFLSHNFISSNYENLGYG